MQRLAAPVPRPRLHLIRFHGVLAPNARLRAAIVPNPAQSEPADEDACGDHARIRRIVSHCAVGDSAEGDQESDVVTVNLTVEMLLAEPTSRWDNGLNMPLMIEWE